VKKRGPSFSRSKRASLDVTREPSEVALAAAAASESPLLTSTSAVSLDHPQPASPFKTPVAATSPSRRPQRSASASGRSAISELQSAKQTLKEQNEQLRQVSMRSSRMNNSAANFATVAQGLLDASSKKK